MSGLHRVTVGPEQCGGRPCLRGLRVMVSDILELLAAGSSQEEILGDYPYLEAGDIAAVLEYAARQLDHPVLLTHTSDDWLEAWFQLADGTMKDAPPGPAARDLLEQDRGRLERQ